MWHYQVTRQKVDEDDVGGEEFAYTIREVYHDIVNDNDLGVAWTSVPIQPYGETKEELVRCLNMMLEDAEKHPVLDITNPDYPYLVKEDR